VTAGVTLLVYGIVKAESYGWLGWETWARLAGAAVLLGAFVLIERAVKVPLVRLGIFRMRHLTGANLVMLAVMGGLFGTFFFTSIYVQNILGFSAIETGVAFLPMTLTIILFSGIAQQLLARVSPRNIGIVGMVTSAVGLLMLRGIEAGGSYWTDLLPGILVIAAGLGLTFVPLTLIATSGVRDDDAGLASGLFNTSQQVGGALGLAILTTVANSYTSSLLGDLPGAPTAEQQASAVVEGFQRGFVAGAGLMAVGAVLLAVLVRKRDMDAVEVDRPVTAHI
jgi:predicted MFS family arabinose efflux permease